MGHLVHLITIDELAICQLNRQIESKGHVTAILNSSPPPANIDSSCTSGTFVHITA